MPEHALPESLTSLAGRRLLVLSPVLPRRTSGGEIILYRHLTRLAEAVNVEVTVAVTNGEAVDCGERLEITAPPGFLTQMQQGLERLTRTRLAAWARAVRWTLPARYVVSYHCKALQAYLTTGRPDVILTVAHGEMSWLAMEMATEFRVPLVSFFHDWFPDYLEVPAWARARLEARFRRLYQQSRVAFVVSEGLKQALGAHPDATILYPIPDHPAPVPSPGPPASTQQKPLVLGYLGNLSGSYGSLVRRLWETLKGQADLSLRMWGPPPDWLETLLPAHAADVPYGGYAPPDILRTVDVLLVVASFAQKDAKLMRTNFPSKLVEYCRFGKPVLFWGPEYSSGAQWAKQHKAAWIVTEDTPDAVLAAIRQLVNQPEEWQRLALAAQEAAHRWFNPHQLQAQFVTGLARAIGRQP
ncbi:MAG: glycosyltransferase [Acidobacteriota bacterium]